ncbi:MAG: pyridoxal-dependent decarboxylase [Clostridium sp.]
MNENDMDLKSMFLGAKSENADVFSYNLLKMFNDHAQWRKDFHPEDNDIITKDHMSEDFYINSRNKMEEALDELSAKLRKNMMPWHSPRYIGHMNSEILMPAVLGYFAGMLYNGNNVAYEGAPATSALEEEVGNDFCTLMGINPITGWGHITADGSTANYESLWYMRNIKSMPLAIKEVVPNLVEGKSEWELLNMPVESIMSLLDKVPEKLDEIKEHSARADSSEISKLGKLLVPETKHYSWLKAADILGIGLENLVAIPVDDKFRMNIDLLKGKIDELISKSIPILGVVSVVGTTEEGAVDNVDKVVALKKSYAEKGINFYYHIDAAYGGYGRAIFLDENNKFIEMDKLKEKYLDHKVFSNANVSWPSNDVYNSFKAMSEADSITVDPHKMGYVPYKAGGIVIKDRRMRNTISYFASYAFQKDTKIPDLLGAFIMEGSKAGAAASSVWVAHKTMPLNITGYGRLIGASVEGAFNLYNKILSKKEYKIGNKTVEVHILTNPDFNMVDYVFNLKGNKDLDKMNELTFAFYKKSSYFTEPFMNDFIVSHTQFSYADYKNSPVELIERCGISKVQWDKVHKLTLIRSCVVTPYLNDIDVFNYYSEQIDKSIINKLSEILESGEF